MSMISELVKNLRDKAIGCEAFGVVETGKLLSQAADVIEELSAKVEKQNVKHGHWIFGETYGCSWMKCSECLKVQNGQTACFTYCPNCGAKMMDKSEGE